nr:uncharacterized protein LOC129429173 [Misgurnus anguillicaudatus]
MQTIKGHDHFGTVKEVCKEPRSYIIESNGGTYRRNRRHILPVAEPPPLQVDPADFDCQYANPATPVSPPYTPQTPHIPRETQVTPQPTSNQQRPAVQSPTKVIPGTSLFYPFGTGDTENERADDGSSEVIYLLQPFIFFGLTYNQIYVNNNGHLTFDVAWDSNIPYSFSGYDGKDIIAPFWTNIDNSFHGVISYQQYTSGSVLTQATEDINQYFPDLSFSASWVFVATWDRVQYRSYLGTETSFQVVLISNGNFSFVLMNYGKIARSQRFVQAGYDTINSSYYFSITESLQDFSSLTYSSNVNVSGRWAFRADLGSRCQFNDTGPFYPFGTGDTENERADDGSSAVIYLLQPFVFFGLTYNQIYVNNNGDLTFNAKFYSYSPYSFPAHGGIDIIAPFWTDIDNRFNGVISYRQYTSGSVLTQATQDINQYFPDLSFSASWVFVATWDRVAYFSNSGTETSFQVVLISNGIFSFVLMNYGTIARSQRFVQAGYDTIDSGYYFSITESLQNDFTYLTYSSNVNVSGRWAFRTDLGSRCQFNGEGSELGICPEPRALPNKGRAPGSVLGLNPEHLPYSG